RTFFKCGDYFFRPTHNRPAYIFRPIHNPLVRAQCRRMKTNSLIKSHSIGAMTSIALGVATLWTGAASISTARADETCSSPYLARIEGQEEFVYVWTLGVEGLGDGADKLVVVNVKPG